MGRSSLQIDCDSCFVTATPHFYLISLLSVEVPTGVVVSSLQRPDGITSDSFELKQPCRTRSMLFCLLSPQSRAREQRGCYKDAATIRCGYADQGAGPLYFPLCSPPALHSLHPHLVHDFSEPPPSSCSKSWLEISKLLLFVCPCSVFPTEI